MHQVLECDPKFRAFAKKTINKRVAHDAFCQPRVDIYKNANRNLSIKE